MLDTLRDLYGKVDSEQPADSHESIHEEKGVSLDSGPTESITTTTSSSGIGIELESLESIPGSSSSSLASSHQRTVDVNESGRETEEDDGMIWVGRPTGTT